MEFREATADLDVQLLAGMNRDLIRDEGHRNPMNEAELRERMHSWLSGGYRAVVFMAGAEPVGYVLWRTDEEYVYVRQFYVRPEHRRQGYGRSALHWLRRNRWGMATAVRIEVLVGNRAGIDFWRAVGFQDYSITMECQSDA